MRSRPAPETLEICANPQNRPGDASFRKREAEQVEKRVRLVAWPAPEPASAGAQKTLENQCKLTKLGPARAFGSRRAEQVEKRVRLAALGWRPASTGMQKTLENTCKLALRS